MIAVYPDRMPEVCPARACEVIVNLDAHVSATDAATHLAARGVCRHLVYVWRTAGRIREVGRRGRSPLYRWRDLLQAERDTRVSGSSHRTAGCRSCDRVAERERLAALAA